MGAYPYDQIENPIIWGCMDEEACNYDTTANADDGSCWATGYNCDDANIIQEFYNLNDIDYDTPYSSSQSCQTSWILEI